MSVFQTSEIAPGFYNIEQRLEHGMVRSFLLVGNEMALLIDTCMGQGIKDEVEQITKLPLMVIFTHADRDHVGEAEQFDHRLMHPCEFDYYEFHNENTVTMDPVWEGDIIDLGGYELEVILIPGHTPGSIALLEREKRFLIAGDSIQRAGVFMFGQGRNFQAFRASMEKLQERADDFDVIYASHNDVSYAPNVVEDLIAGVDDVLNGDAEITETQIHDQTMKLLRSHDVVFLSK